MNNDQAIIEDDVNRRAVLRINHDVDRAGHVIHVQLEPLLDVPMLDVVNAAWYKARRCHPWIIGDEASERLEAAKEIALSQINHLLEAAGEAVFHARGIEHDAFRRLRDAAMDLRGYLPALHGYTPVVQQQVRIWRSA